jgi:hypothetical protein
MQVKFCPRCKKPVEARDFMDPFYLGALDSMMPQMNCSCGYVGLPIVMSKKDYMKMVRDSERRRQR